MLLGSQLSKSPLGWTDKMPDVQRGPTLIPWHGGRSLVWDVTVVSPLAASYVDRAAIDAGTVADMTAARKTEIVDPILSIQVRAYSSRKSWRLQFHNSELYFRTRPPNLCSHRTCVPETSYLFQRISIMLQRFNSVLLHDTLPVDLPDL